MRRKKRVQKDYDGGKTREQYDDDKNGVCFTSVSYDFFRDEPLDERGEFPTLLKATIQDAGSTLTVRLCFAHR